MYSRVKESNHHCLSSRNARLYAYKLIRTALTLRVPKQNPKILSTPLRPITAVSLDKIDPKNLRAKKEDKKKITKDTALVISGTPM